MKIFIDRGHGLNNSKPGKVDPGAVNGLMKLNESALVTQIAHEVERSFWHHEPRILVSPEISIPQVVNWVNSRSDDDSVFFVFHMNAGSSPQPTGLEVLYHGFAPDERADQAVAISEFLANEMGIRCRGVLPDVLAPKGKPHGLPILKTRCPAFLIEWGFITNPNDVEIVQKKAAPAFCKLIEEELPAILGAKS